MGSSDMAESGGTAEPSRIQKVQETTNEAKDSQAGPKQPSNAEHRQKVFHKAGRSSRRDHDVEADDWWRRVVKRG
jgi:hypothetical protein